MAWTCDACGARMQNDQPACDACGCSAPMMGRKGSHGLVEA